MGLRWGWERLTLNSLIQATVRLYIREMLNLEISPDTQLINEGRDDWGINHMQVTILPQTYDCALPAAYQY